MLITPHPCIVLSIHMSAIASLLAHHILICHLIPVLSKLSLHLITTDLLAHQNHSFPLHLLGTGNGFVVIRNFIVSLV
jgi:hypothetical protein